MYIEYNPLWPIKNLSQSGLNGKGPLVKNKKATLGTLSNGYSSILGTNDARQKSSSSVIPCIKCVGPRKLFMLKQSLSQFAMYIVLGKKSSVCKL